MATSKPPPLPLPPLSRLDIWSATYVIHWNRCVHQLERRGVPRARAKEFVQDAFMNALPMDFTTVREPPAYIYKIAFNRAAAEHALDAEGPVTFDSKTVDELLLREGPEDTNGHNTMPDHLSFTRDVVARIAELPPRERAALALWLQGYRHREIGQQLGIPTHRVGDIVARAQRHLKEFFSQPTQGPVKP